MNFLPERGYKASHNTLEPNKFYLDSCTTFHSNSVKEILKDVGDSDSVLHGNFNVGTKITSQKGHCVYFKIWLNKSGVTYFLFIPQLEEDDYRASYDTLGDWVVITPQVPRIKFKLDRYMCNLMPYIDIRKSQDYI